MASMSKMQHAYDDFSRKCHAKPPKKTRACSNQNKLWEFDEDEGTITFIWDDEEEINNLYTALRERNLEIHDLDYVPETVDELHELLLEIDGTEDLDDDPRELLVYHIEDEELEFDDMSYYDMIAPDRRELKHKKSVAQFDHMWPAVKAMCESLMYEPHLWEFGNHTFNKKGSKLEYWTMWDSCVTEIWCNGSDTSVRGTKVFSPEQGEQIAKALKIAKQSSRRPEQELVMQSLGLLEKSVVDQRARSMTFWQRLVFLFTGRCKNN